MNPAKKTPLRFADFLKIMKVPEKTDENSLGKVLSTMIAGSNDGDKENVSPSIVSDGQTRPTTDEYSSSSSNNHVDHVDCPEDSDCVFEILEHPKRVDESFGDVVGTYDEFRTFLNKTSVASDSIANNGSIDFQKDLVDSTPSAPETHPLSTPAANESTANPDTTFLVTESDEFVAKHVIERLIVAVEKKTERQVPKMLSTCNCKAKRCTQSIDDVCRRTIHTKYWEIEEDHGRRLWLQNNVSLEEPKRRYSDPGPRKRKYTRYFFLPNVEKKGFRIYVCQTMFLHTLGYKSDEVLRTVQNSTDEADVVAKSKRGKRAPTHKISSGDEQYIRDHMKSCNPCISHYRRAHAPNRQYLPSELSVKEMHADYKHCCDMDNRKAFSEIKYRRIVKEMNISFANFGIEECETCDEYKITYTNIKRK